MMSWFWFTDPHLIASFLMTRNRDDNDDFIQHK